MVSRRSRVFVVQVLCMCAADLGANPASLVPGDQNTLKLGRCSPPHCKSSDKRDKSKPLLLTRIFSTGSDFELHDSTATESVEAVLLARHGCNIQHPEAICAHNPASTSEPARRCERVPNWRCLGPAAGVQEEEAIRAGSRHRRRGTESLRCQSLAAPLVVVCANNC